MEWNMYIYLPWSSFAGSAWLFEDRDIYSSLDIQLPVQCILGQFSVVASVFFFYILTSMDLGGWAVLARVHKSKRTWTETSENSRQWYLYTRDGSISSSLVSADPVPQR